MSKENLQKKQFEVVNPENIEKVHKNEECSISSINENINITDYTETKNQSNILEAKKIKKMKKPIVVKSEKEDLSVFDKKYESKLTSDNQTNIQIEEANMETEFFGDNPFVHSSLEGKKTI